MVAQLYSTGIRLYPAVLRLAAPFHAKARRWLAGQHNLLDTIADKLGSDADTRPIVWFHAASLGEFEQGRPVMEAFRAAYPQHRILLTFFSPSGYDVRKDYDGADYVFYLPIDTPANARRFVQLVKPELVFFIKYEFWANYLRELHRANVPVVSFSAIFRSDQLFFKPYGEFYRQMLRQFNHLLVQNQESVDLLRSIGITNVTLAGDTRFDRVAQTVATIRDIPIANAFKAGQPLLVVGSAWPLDMDVLIPFINQFDKPLKVIVAPHEIDGNTIADWQKRLTRPSVRFSQTNEIDVLRADILFIDNVGMLSSLYQYGEFAFIGGAFREGLHNILEAATFGMPIFFGPVYDKFQEAVDLVQEGGAFPVSTTEELQTTFAQQYNNRQKAAQITRLYVQRNIGATARVMDVAAKIKSERANE
ncbi:3-deoxy-D-manno-octulosonic acid transferase [Spirosoma rhododendri]|uniref:3-deoxy-D-manno-octulosonic acid transferase n=1 Tax=Spirosoma rhododendri TaxID=2728024 RepID=A0A7L5DS79_9BACT|nr:3-deoxy-D-manno-octulosonic acid transferase [Spirosoma rhododendri]